MVGAVIGSYRLVRTLGEGGMGVVYLGQHTLLGRRAAIKVLLPALSARPDVVDRFFNEARAVTSISDPGIVQVFDFGYHTDGSAFIVMELLEGEPLNLRLARLRRFSVHEALRLCRQVATSLAAAHAQNIIHRDLKPENIFLVRDAEVASGERSKILDFGIAKLSDVHPGKIKTHTGELMGSPLYMSPEQCRGLATIDHRSDGYALGCVLFHLITGQPPFEGEGMGDIISAHIREPAPVPSSRAPGIPPSVDALVLRCLAKSPAERYPSMTELAAAISQVLAQLPPDAARPHGHGADGGQAASVPPAHDSRPATPLQSPPPGYASPAVPTTLGASSGQIARSSLRSTRIGRWIAGGLVLGATGAGIAIVAAGKDQEPRIVVTHEAGSASPADRPPARSGTPIGSLAAAFDAGVALAVAPPPPASAPDPAPAEPNAPPAAAGPGVAAEPAPMVDPAATREPSSKSSRRDRAHKPSPSNPPPSPSPPTSSQSPPRTSPAPPHPTPSPAPVARRCSKADFAAVYNAAAPSRDALNTALSTLRECHTAGAIDDAEFSQTQAALVAKLMAKS